ncbi:MAG: peptide-methionine (R)-S-oxide reductase MsrB [Candidatus Buchananbacteria bacterium]|nr:peptide-methionine (R)-S-oxide reductase MsrB [Candidatus Buchananbacteria bacterium]
MTEDFWQKKLGPQQYNVLRQKGTEAPFSGQYYLTKDKGVYKCGACGIQLFASDMKFESDCGWPSFDKAIPCAVEFKADDSHGMKRTEVLCSNCGSHLGHIFDDGPTETGQRYCINSLALDLHKEE